MLQPSHFFSSFFIFLVITQLQVIPRETKRVWDQVLSSDRVMSSVSDYRIPLSDRLDSFHSMLLKDHLDNLGDDRESVVVEWAGMAYTAHRQLA